MSKKNLQWINTPVIVEALFRYEKDLLPKSMRLWIEDLLEINEKS